MVSKYKKDQEQARTLMSKANYIGLVLELYQVKEIPIHSTTFKRKLIYHKPMYAVTVRYVSYREDLEWISAASKETTEAQNKDSEGTFELKKKEWSFENPLEATAKFEKVRNLVRNLGKFRNLNKGKIPDYRDLPS